MMKYGEKTIIYRDLVEEIEENSLFLEVCYSVKFRGDSTKITIDFSLRRSSEVTTSKK